MKNIIRRLQSKDESICIEAFEELYNYYYKLAYFCIVNIVKNNQDTEELLNDVFIKVYEHRHSLKAEKNVKYYIVSIAKNLSIDFIRKKHQIIEFNDNYVLEYITPSKDDCYSFSELIDMLKEKLSNEEIDIIIYHFLYNETFKNIAKKLGKSSNTIRTIYYRSLKKVKK